jgi:Tol biopolymer transport system component
VSGGTDGVYLVDADGTNLRPLLHVGEHDMTFASQPLWSPDGSTVLVRGEFDLFLIGVDGSNFRNLTNTPENEDSAGSWSPDGKWIAFEGDQGGGCVFRIKPDGTGLERLTIGCSQGFSMSWAPDSSRIALAGGTHGLADITVINADGSNPAPLTDTRDIAEIAWGP